MVVGVTWRVEASEYDRPSFLRESLYALMIYKSCITSIRPALGLCGPSLGVATIPPCLHLWTLQCRRRVSLYPVSSPSFTALAYCLQEPEIKKNGVEEHGENENDNGHMTKKKGQEPQVLA